MKRQRAFTLIEVMIVVAIVGILASVAYPSYQQYVLKTHRAVAAACAMEVAQFMERYYTTTMTYVGAALPALACRTDLAARYTLEFDATLPTTASTYRILAVPVAGGPQARDTRCATLRIDQTGLKTVSGSASAAECW